MTVSSEISMTASSMTSVRTTSATSMAVSGVPSMTMSSEASLDEAAGSPHLVPKPPPQIDLDSETVFGDEESCLPIRVVSDTTREGKEKAGRKRELDKVWPSTPTHKRRNSLPASKQPPASAPRGAFSSPMVCGISRTPLRVSHGGMGALEAPSPSSSLLSTPTRCRGGELVGGASPSPATTKGNMFSALPSSLPSSSSLLPSLPTPFSPSFPFSLLPSFFPLSSLPLPSLPHFLLPSSLPLSPSLLPTLPLSPLSLLPFSPTYCSGLSRLWATSVWESCKLPFGRVPQSNETTDAIFQLRVNI